MGKKKKTELDPSLFLYTKLNSRGINNLNVKINTIKQYREKEDSYYLGKMAVFLIMSQRPEMKRRKPDKFYFVKKKK